MAVCVISAWSAGIFWYNERNRLEKAYYEKICGAHYSVVVGMRYEV